VIYALVLAWFVQRFLPGLSLAPPERAEVVAWAALEVLIVAALFLFVALERLKARRVFELRCAADRRAFGLLGLWFCLCVWNTFAGLAKGNDWGYLAGDAYRFGSLPLLVSLVYFAVRDGEAAHRLVRGLVAAYGCMVTVDLFRFNTLLPADDPRLTTETAHEAGMLVAAVIFLMLYDRRRGWRVFSGAMLLMIFVLLFRAQMLTPLLTSIAALALFFFLNRRFAVLLAGAAAAALLVAASLYAPAVSPDAPSYIADKLDAAEASPGALESVQALSGVRSGEIISIVDDLSGHPAHLLLGTGEGTLVSPDPVVPLARLIEDKHYVHAGLFDALYHNGAIAVAALLAFGVHVFRRGLRLHSAGNPFGLFVTVALAVTLILLSYDLPLESSVPVLALSFAGISALEPRPAPPADPAFERVPRRLAKASGAKLPRSGENANA
jgi:hypothetical protein